MSKLALEVGLDAGERAGLRPAECVLAVTTDGDSDAAQIEGLALMMFSITRRDTGQDNPSGQGSASG